MRLITLVCVCLLSDAWAHHDDLHEIIESKQRSATAKARDDARHPYETLTFFGVAPDMTVVELWPGGGWYTDIIAPYVAREGEFIAAHFNPASNHRYADFFRSSLDAYQTKLQNNSSWYQKVVIRPFEPPETPPLAEFGSVDMVLSFRSVHNWMADGVLKEVLREVHKILRPGGVFGVVESRANPDDPVDKKATNGYVNQAWLIETVNSVGFQMVANSEINANPKDTADHPNGVWTLPPRLQLPEGENPAKYNAIGESDRFTLKFVKVGR